MKFTLSPLGDCAIIIKIGDKIEPNNQSKVRAITVALDKANPSWLVEYIPAFTAITVFYDVIKLPKNKPYDAIHNALCSILKGLETDTNVRSQTIEIPVFYGGESGPDLAYVAKHNELAIDDVIRIHTESVLDVNMIGFSPGFPYISGMSKKIATPRKSTPRLSIPARSVGIAGSQTGIYPIETPGGWQIIGRTPTRLFRPDLENPSLLQAGDKIRFKSISFEEFQQLEDNI